MHKIATIVVLLIVSTGMWGCASSSDVNAETAEILPASADLIAGQTQHFNTNVGNSKTATWAVNGNIGGDSAVGTIDENGNYTAPATQPAAPVMVSATNTARPTVTASATVTVVGSGTVSATLNPQVATYTIAPPVVAGVSVQFGTDTTYGLTTSVQQSGGNATALGILVAGMVANTVYHMRAALQLPDGSTLYDADHTFTTGSLPKGNLPQITVSTPNGLTPQPGVEMLNLLDQGAVPPVIATDLQGNVIWSYQPGGTAADIVQPVKPLPNGHFLVTLSPNSAAPLNTEALPAGTLDVVREIDLAGNIIREISVDTLNTKLAAAGFNYTADIIHHDVAVLPNGHWILIVNSTQQFTNITGHPGTQTILGDALVDLDTNLNPVWFWNSFDHLDVNREPYSFPDWTHSNAVLYSATDGNLLLSMRHQSWIIKIDYANGKGAGDVLWKLGYQGDFTLTGATDPTDWFSTQHGPSFTTPNSAGSFGLAVFDDGDNRQYPTGETCKTSDSPLCPYYTSVQVLTIDETAKTATPTFLDKLAMYSYYGGNAETLANSNVEYDLCSVVTTPISTAVYEVTPTSPAETVWQLTTNNANAYRAFRLPSLYPGVQWP